MTTTTTQAPAVAPFWLPDGCPEWCEYTHWHSDEDHPDDRHHDGAEREVNLRLEAPVLGGAGWHPETIVVHLTQTEGDVAPHVDIRRGDDPPTVRMTLSEARELASALLAVVGEAS
jgi:hypothetical protein